MNIYLICTGNTCRSPMAEAILRGKDVTNMCVRSAGIYAQEGMPIAENAKTLITNTNLPYTAVSRAVTAKDIEWADYIFTMTTNHQRALLQLFPTAARKTHTLKGFIKTSVNEDVHDPFGGDLETYTKTFTELSTIMDALVLKLTEG